MSDPLSPCPFCTADTVERHYAMHADGTDPGCLTCEETRTLAEWERLVADATAA